MECPRCDADIGHDVNYCRSCGLPIGKLRQAVRDWNCPRCELEFDGQPSTCPECGLHLGKLRDRIVTAGQASSEPGPGPDSQPHSEQTETAGDRPLQGGQQPATESPEPQSGPTATQQRQQPPAAQQAGQPGQQGDYQPPPSERQPNGSGQPVYGSSGPTGTAHGLFQRLPVVPAVVAGIAAYVLNYVVFFILVSVEFSDSSASSAIVGETEIAGWFLYNAHQVEIEGTVTTASGTTSETINYLVEAYSSQSTTVPDFLYYLVPMVVLYLAALSVVRRATPPVDRWKDGAALGIPLAGGYAAATLFGALSLFSIESSGGFGGSESVQPELVPALLFMGIIYPVVIGGIAGAIGARESLF